MANRHERFKKIGYEDFKKLAQDKSLTQYEKIGFPKSYRHDKEHLIFEDLLEKLGNLSKSGLKILDIGCGCSDLVHILIRHCTKKRHELFLVDSEEMLRLVPGDPVVKKVPGKFPEMEKFLKKYQGKFDVILCYSVLHYVFAEGNLHSFVDQAAGLLAPGGELLLGDIPNISKRKRFFDSPAGIKFHQAFMKTKSKPEVHFSVPEPGEIDDGVLFGLVFRYRGFGYDSFVLPQRSDLPMSNRREDVLIRRA